LLIVSLTAVVVGPSSSALAVDKETEAAAIEFARTHHPELAGLLDQLRMNAPKEYEAAITDLNRSRERLEKTRDRLPERYALELAEWKLNSRIRLLAARMAMSADADLEADLRSTLRERTEVRRKLLQEERDRTAKRVEKLDEQINEQLAQADKIVDREFATIQRTISNSASKAANAAKARGVPAAKPNPTKTSPKPDGKKSDARKSDAKKSDDKKPNEKPATDKPKTNAKSPDKK
jgi:hypothetical protein